MLAPVIRVMARRLLPSLIIPTICARLAVLSLFILNIMLERYQLVNRLNRDDVLSPETYGKPSYSIDFRLFCVFRISENYQVSRFGDYGSANRTPRRVYCNYLI